MNQGNKMFIEENFLESISICHERVICPYTTGVMSVLSNENKSVMYSETKTNAVTDIMSV